MPEYISGKKRTISVGIKSYSENNPTTNVIGDVIVTSGRIGVGTTNPTQDVDVQTIRVRDTLYDYTNYGGEFGYFLAKDTGGIKWVAVPPIESNAIFISENNNILGVSSFIGINIISDELLGVSTNPTNSTFADITIIPRWAKSGDSGIYTTKNVGIGTTIPIADFQVGFGTTGVTIDGATGIVSALGYYGNYSIIGVSTVNQSFTAIGLGGTHVSVKLATAGGITTTGGDLYVGKILHVDDIDAKRVETDNFIATGISTQNIAKINTGIVTNLTVTGITTFTNGPVLIGTAVSTGTVNQPLQVAGSGYVSGNLGLGVINPTVKLDVSGDGRFTGVVTATSFYGNLFGNATSATIAGYAATAGIATYSVSAGVATYANTAGIATYAVNAGVATYANTSGIATYANTAGIATYANVSGISTYANVSGVATYAVNAGVATYANAAGIATYANISGIATYASVSGVATTAINLSGGVSGNVPYQSNIGITSFVINGLSGQILLFDGVRPIWSNVSAASGAFGGITVRDDGDLVGTANSITTLNFSTGIAAIASTGANGIATITVAIPSYVPNSGVSTSVIGGIGSITSLTVSGITTTGQLHVGIGGTIITTTTGGFVGVNTTIPLQPFQVNPFGNNVVVVDNTGELGIGTTNPQVKLDVIGNARFTGIVTASNIFVSGLSTVGNFSMTPIGTGSTVGGIGVTYYGDGSRLTGIAGGVSISTNTTNQNQLIPYSLGTGTTTGFGVTTGGLVFNPSTTRLGIGTTTPASNLHIVGNVLVTGVTTSTDFNSSSDETLKTNIRRINNPVEKVMGLNGVQFDWIATQKASAGLIAQDVQKVLPELTSGDPLSLNYNGIIGLLVEVVKQQQLEIEKIQQQLNKLS
jgi:hypothetical protein